jgi:hypothetical protein
MFTDLLFVDDRMSFGAFMILYLTMTVLLGVVYHLGFARKLPILKAAVVYLVLALGALPLAFLGIALPVVEALVIAVLMLAIVRYRMKKSTDS